MLKKSLNLINNKKNKGIKIWTPRQILQRLPIALEYVKAGNTDKNILNEIKQKQAKAGNRAKNLSNEIIQILYSLYWEKEVTKKVYNNIMNSIML